MTSPGASKDKFFEKVINPYLAEVLRHPQTIEMREGVLHIRDVEGPRCTESVETKLEAMEQQVFKCQGMVERGLNANQMMIAEFTNNHKLDAKVIGETIFKLQEKIEHLQAQIYDLQNQNCEYEYRFKRMSLAADLRIPETRPSFYDGEPMPWKTDDKPTSSTTPTSPAPRAKSHGYGHSPWQLPSLGEVPRHRITITLLSLLLYIVRSF